MRGPLGSPRVLLRRLREAMAEPVGAQQRLDRIVVLIASNMVAEVCSVYLLRDGATLELFATEGLKKEAVHNTRLRVGEGLVGLIAEQAEPLNLPEAQQHPAFAYRPETGEDIYHSFLGVPILRAGNTLGVLVVQNRTPRVYSVEEVEALQTISMVLAELVAAGEIPDAAKPITHGLQSGALHLQGVALAEGLALGHAVLHEPRIVVTELIADDIVKEAERLDEALQSLRSWTDNLLLSGDVARAGEHREVLEAYRMFAHDRGWAQRMREAVATGLTAEAAVERVQNDTRARLQRQTDPYLRERLHDLDDLSNRLLRVLSGKTLTAAAQELPRDAIVIARNMGPAELLDYDRSRLRGLVLEEGGANSHVAIVARALGIATVAEIANIQSAVEAGDPIIIDGVSGEVHVRPPAEIVTAYADKVRLRAKRLEQYAALRDVPAVSVDGEKIRLLINAGLVVELPHLFESGAEGIGLFRTEFQFMISSTFPRMREQLQIYREVLETAGNRHVVFRSLDVGGDKVMPFLRHTQEENPALGWRAIRMALDRPALLRTQIRALLHAAAGGTLNLMFPMITETAEFRAAKVLFHRECAHLERYGHELPRNIKLGAMIEVPALLFDLDTLLRETDFVSVGSNDLLQFLWACDRGNSRMAGRFDGLSPSVLRALRVIAEKAHKHDCALTLCGEMASKPLEALVLLALGYRSISMSPPAIPAVKAAILKTDIAQLRSRLFDWVDDSSENIRAQLCQYCEANGIPL